MKKILFILITLLANANVYASDVTGDALSMRTQIKNYLAQEGYVPSIDEDGDIAFKYEGTKYYISCENYSEMVYLTVSSYIGAGDTNATLLRRVCNDVQRGLKIVRINLSSSQETVTIECADVLTSITEFKRMFYNYMTILQLADERIKDKYNEN